MRRSETSEAHVNAWDLATVFLFALQSGGLGATGYNLGLHVLNRMLDISSPFITLSISDIEKLGVTVYGYELPPLHLIAEKGGWQRSGDTLLNLQYITALQQLHRLGLMYSALDEKHLKSTEFLAGHFTLDPRADQKVSAKKNTPISFLIPTSRRDLFLSDVRRKMGLKNTMNPVSDFDKHVPMTIAPRIRG